MATTTGLSKIIADFPKKLENKNIGLLCHAASISSDYTHIVDCFKSFPCRISALFGPQHGLFGQTQDNMVEWEGYLHPHLRIPVYSLYGKTRKPDATMLSAIDAMVIDLQDVGARPYTYLWTMKLCMEACMEKGLPFWVLDRPNPIAPIRFDGPLLLEEHYSFVGGAPIPLCHRLTIGEIATLLKHLYFPSLDLNIVWMDGWSRSLLFNDTGLPWVLPSPNMPTLDTAIAYPGMVLLEATNVSEGRGTTRPFEIVGAPFVKINELLRILRSFSLPGCIFREHGFIPAFQKWHGSYCSGIQVHVTDPKTYCPVYTTVAFLSSIIMTSRSEFKWKNPPYEYEKEKMPFDILSGNGQLRKQLEQQETIRYLMDTWNAQYQAFIPIFKEISRYPEE